MQEVEERGVSIAFHTGGYGGNIDQVIRLHNDQFRIENLLPPFWPYQVKLHPLTQVGGQVATVIRWVGIGRFRLVADTNLQGWILLGLSIEVMVIPARDDQPDAVSGGQVLRLR